MAELVMGIDEAGRGSIVGPMVVSGVLLDERILTELARNGVDDSKELTPEQRRGLYSVIIAKSIWYSTVIVPPALIDSLNLNKLTGLVAYYILKRACSFYKVDRATIDMVRGVKFPPIKCGYNTVHVRVEEKADSRYPEVAAASILAKVVRDSIIEKLREEYGLLGSGYPGDMNTIRWLKENYTRLPPGIVRRKWSTLSKLGIAGQGKLVRGGGRDASEPTS